MISLPLKLWPQNPHAKFWNHHTLYGWLMCGPFGTLSLQNPRDSDLVQSQCIKPAGSGFWKAGLLKRSLNISSCLKPPEIQTLWLSFILDPVSFKRDQLLEPKLMCLCGHSILLKLTETEIDESNQFVNLSKETALKVEVDQIHTFPSWWRKFNFSFTLKKFCVYSQKLFWTVL